MRSSQEALFDIRPRRAVLLAGLAGSGKTQLLDELAALGEQVINLERLANHSGSVFGGLGRSLQPSHNKFQRLVCDIWSAADHRATLWIEEEGPFIGSVGLPSSLFSLLPRLPVVEVYTDRDDRIKRLAEEYGSIPQADLEAALKRLCNRIGGVRTMCAIQAVQSRRLRDAVEIVLPYYDDAYQYRMTRQPRRTLAIFRPRTDEPADLIRLVRGALEFAFQPVVRQKPDP